MGGMTIRDNLIPLNVTATRLVCSGPGYIVGITVASSSSGTIKLWDATSATGTVILGTTSMSASQFLPIMGDFENGLYATVGGTLDCTISFGRK